MLGAGQRNILLLQRRYDTLTPLLFITDHIPKDAEGYILTPVCQSVQRGGGRERVPLAQPPPPPLLSNRM